MKRNDARRWRWEVLEEEEKEEKELRGGRKRKHCWLEEERDPTSGWKGKEKKDCNAPANEKKRDWWHETD